MKRQPKSSGFTLVELMIAMGILAIGLTMIATAFPTGVRNVNDSWDDTMFTLIAENGLAITRAKLTHANLNGKSAGEQSFGAAYSIAPTSAGVGDLTYPITPANTTPSSRYSWRVYTRQLLGSGVAGQAGQNLYQVVIAVYRKNTPTSLNDTALRSPAVDLYGGNVTDLSGPLSLGTVPNCALIGYYTVRTGIAP